MPNVGLIRAGTGTFHTLMTFQKSHGIVLAILIYNHVGSNQL